MRMKHMKKAVSFVLTFVLVLSCFLWITPEEVKAEGYELKKDVTYELCLIGGTTDTYTYEVPDNGYFYIEVTPTYYTKEDGETVNSTSWWLPFRISANYKEYENVNCHRSDGTYTSKMYSFAPGTKVQLEFSSNTSGYLWYYNVSIYQVKETRFETENNNSKNKSDSISEGKYYNALMMKDDTDWFVFKAPKTGKYKVYLVNTDTNSGRSWMGTTVYNGSSKILASANIYSGDGVKRVCTVKLKKGQKLYIKNSNPYGNFLYKIKVKKA
ncbi:MAG: hypothetical protein ACI4CC_04660 [Lachnospiraceae bacterium]